MKSLLFALIIGAGLTSAGTASAQTQKPAPSAPPKAAAAVPVVAAVVYQVAQTLPMPRPVVRVQAEIQRGRQLGSAIAGVSREVRGVFGGRF